MTQADVPPDAAPKQHRLLPGYLVGLLSALALYVLTVAPGPLWQDSGMAQVRVLCRDLFGSLGLALSHPLYYVLAIAFQVLPFAESAFKTNLVSAVFGALTVANILLVIRLLTGGWRGAAVGAVSLAVAHTFWQHCALAEVYTVTTALLSAELLCFLAWQRTRKAGWLILLFLANGLGISNHLLASLSLICWVGWFITQVARGKVRLQLAFLLVPVWLAGAALYLGLIAVRIAAGDGLAATLRSALVGEYGHHVMNLALSGRLLLNSCLYLGLNFPTPAVLLAFIACRSLRGHSLVPGLRMVLVLLVVYLAWAGRYTVPDQYTFFIPSLLYFAILIGVGADRCLESDGETSSRFARMLFRKVPFRLLTIKRRSALGTRPGWFPVMVAAAAIPACVYVPLPKVAERLDLNLGLSRQVPYRNEYEYFLHPWKTGYQGPRQFAEALERSLPDGAILIADGTTVRPIHYALLTGRWGRDVTIYPPLPGSGRPAAPSKESLENELSQGLVFVVTPARGYCPGWLLDGYETQPFGLVYRVVGHLPGRP